MDRNSFDPSQFPEEYFTWLEQKQISKKKLRRNPQLLYSYYDEWLEETPRAKRRKKVLPKVNLNQINSSANKVYSFLSLVQTIHQFLPNPFKKRM